MSKNPITSALISELWPVLKSRGFKRNGTTYVRPTEDGYVMLNLQASAFGSHTSQQYTINTGYYSQVLKPLEKDWRRLTFHDGHWAARIGKFTSADRDLWWTIEVDDNVKSIAEEILGICFAALPRIEALNAALLNGLLRKGYLVKEPPGYLHVRNWPEVDAESDASNLADSTS